MKGYQGSTHLPEMDKPSLEPHVNSVVFFKKYSIDPIYASKIFHYYMKNNAIAIPNREF